MKDRDNIAPNERDEMDEIAELIRFAGERESVNRERMTNARARVAGHWNNVVEAKRKAEATERWRLVAVAASVVVAAGLSLTLWNGQSDRVPQRLVSVERTSGEVRVDGRAVTAGDVFTADVAIQTGPEGRIALSLTDGQSVRLDTETHIVIAANDRLELLRGGVYVDSGLDARDAQLTIETMFGAATDIGTQFQVRIDGEELSVGVREGLVELRPTGADLLEVDSGKLIVVNADGDAFGRPVRSNDDVWRWVAAIAPEFNIDGATLEDYLNWYAREAGLTLRWETAASRVIAKQSRLSGSIADMPLEEGLTLVRLIAPFESRVADSTLHVTVD